MTEKIHKVLARAGLGSRRQIEKWIAEGRIAVDGSVAKTGSRITGRELVEFNGRRVVITPPGPQRVLLYHKAVGEICSRNDPRHPVSVFRQLPPLREGRWIGVGRLDLNTSGLLLFTTDGELADRLMHPSSGIEREYLVRVQGQVPAAAIRRLLDGVMLDGVKLRFRSIVELPKSGGSNRWYRVTVCEGRYREVRRLWQQVGARVNRLQRIRFGPLRLPKNLAPGNWRELRPGERERLYRSVALPAPSRHAGT